MKNRGENMSEEVKEEVLEETQETQEENKEELLLKRIEQLENEVNTWKTDYYKVFADMENLKRRLEKEHQNSMKFILQSFLESLLPVLDNFERSLNIPAPTDEVAAVLKGNQMIYDQLMNVLKKNGLEVIEAQGKEFDPNFHQAVMMVEDENYESNIVVEELQKGYMLKDRVIRASLVKVNQ